MKLAVINDTPRVWPWRVNPEDVVANQINTSLPVGTLVIVEPVIGRPYWKARCGEGNSIPGEDGWFIDPSNFDIIDEDLEAFPTHYQVTMPGGYKGFVWSIETSAERVKLTRERYGCTVEFFYNGNIPKE